MSRLPEGCFKKPYRFIPSNSEASLTGHEMEVPRLTPRKWHGGGDPSLRSEWRPPSCPAEQKQILPEMALRTKLSVGLQGKEDRLPSPWQLIKSVYL